MQKDMAEKAKKAEDARVKREEEEEKKRQEEEEKEAKERQGEEMEKKRVEKEMIEEQNRIKEAQKLKLEEEEKESQKLKEEQEKASAIAKEVQSSADISSDKKPSTGKDEIKISSSEQESTQLITQKKIDKAQVALLHILKSSENNMYESTSVKIKSIFPHSFEEVARKKPDRTKEVKQDITDQIEAILTQLNIQVGILDDRMLDESTRKNCVGTIDSQLLQLSEEDLEKMKTLIEQKYRQADAYSDHIDMHITSKLEP